MKEFGDLIVFSNHFYESIQQSIGNSTPSNKPIHPTTATTTTKYKHSTNNNNYSTRVQHAPGNTEIHRSYERSHSIEQSKVATRNQSCDEDQKSGS